MPLTVWKYLLELKLRQTLELPIGARILCVQLQADSICMWVRCDPTRHKKPRYFEIYGTGHELSVSTSLVYVGTVQLTSFTWHVFEVLPENTENVHNGY